MGGRYPYPAFLGPLVFHFRPRNFLVLQKMSAIFDFIIAQEGPGYEVGRLVSLA